MATRDFSKKQENSVAKAIGGKRTANSGATKFQKGDVTDENWLIECKTSMSEKKSVSIKKEWLEKNQEEAFAMNKYHNALAFDFGDEENYYILNEKQFKIAKDLIDIADLLI